MLKQYFMKFEKGLNKFGVFLSSLFVIALVALILLEIFLRTFFNKSTMISDEYSGYFYLASVFFGLGYTFKEKAHIRINIITTRLNPKFQKIMNIYAGTVTFLVISFILYRVTLMTIDSYNFDILSEGVSATPIYLTQIPMIIGTFIFAVSILAFILKRIGHDS
ncbi:MAG: TRAP transporter small permease [Sulfurospirillaceae bacterium]|nr:TRAP transporter small permease [Sulfurospirillaceae bacterium]